MTFTFTAVVKTTAAKFNFAACSRHAKCSFRVRLHTKDFSVDDRDENDNGLFRLSENISFFSDILKNSLDTSPNSAILSSLFYIAGYCAHSLIKFVNGCENCLIYITTNSDFVINFTNCGENDCKCW
jgi:hypothetical protein